MQRLFQSQETAFDFIFENTDIGTCLMSAIVSSVNKSQKLLHLDPNPFYGSHQATLHPSQFPDSQVNAIPQSSDRKFFLDKSPKTLLSADAVVDSLVAAGCGEFLHFTPVQIFFRFSEEQTFSPLPTSKAAVFADKHFSLAEKRHFMKFVNSVAATLAFASPDKIPCQSVNPEISDWRNYLRSFDLTERQIAMIDSCICFGHPKNTLEGLKKIRTFMHSLGKFADNHALLYPNFGTSEILQALARKAAVNGTLYALNAGIVNDEKFPCVNDVQKIRLTTGDVLEASHILRMPNVEMTCDTVVVVVKDSTHNGGCELKIQAATSALVVGSHTQCCPEGSFILYSRGPDAKQLADELSAGKECLFTWQGLTDQKLLYDEEDLSTVKSILSGVGFNALSF